MSLDLEKILKLLKRNYIILIVVAVISYTLGYYFTQTSSVTTYYSYVELCINSKAYDSKGVQYITAEAGYVPTYLQVLNTYSFFNMVQASIEEERAEQGDNPTIPSISSASLKSMTSMEQKNDTPIIRLKFTSSDKTATHEIVRIIGETVDDFLGEELNVSGTWIVDKLPQPIVSSIPATNDSIAASLIGTIVAFIVLFFIDASDNRVNDPESLSERYDIPVLGVIPYLSSGSKFSKKFEKYSRFGKYGKYSKYGRYSYYGRSGKYGGYGSYSYSSHSASTPYEERKKEGEENEKQ